MGKLKKHIILAFIEGFLLVSSEILISKILYFNFGSSYFVWVAVLSITMLAASFGYFFGSKVVKFLNFKNVFTLIGLFFLIDLAIHLKFFSIINFDSYLSNLIFLSFLLIFPVVFLITSIIMFLIEDLNKEQKQYDGLLFSISSVGGIIAALLVGFYFLTQFGLIISLMSYAIFCILIGFFQLGKSKFSLIFYGAFLLVFLYNYSNYRKMYEPKPYVKLIYENDGILGNLKVFDVFNFQENYTYRSLLINNVDQTYIRNNEFAQSFWSYPHVISYFATCKDKNAKVLLMGLAGGSVANELLRQQMEVDVVEIDERMISLASNYFYLDTTKLNFYIDDARAYLNKTKKKYDIIIIDLLNGEEYPSHVFTKENLKKLDERLNEKGIVIVNYQGSIYGKYSTPFQILFKTFSSSDFDVRVWSSLRGSITDDIVFLLAKDKIKNIAFDTLSLGPCCLTIKAVKKVIKHPFVNYKLTDKSVPILTDNFSFFELLNAQRGIAFRKHKYDPKYKN